MAELYALLQKSEKFVNWNPAADEDQPLTISDLEQSNIGTEVVEKHYTPAELAKVWGVDAETIRNLFRNEPGVLKLGSS
jgi:hypothetical protein